MQKKEHSYGIIAIRKKGKQTLLVKHGKGHWAFPKGHPYEKEEPKKTATREFAEETGLKVNRFLPIPSLEEHYFFHSGKDLIEKTVTYFVAEVEGEVWIQKEEIDDYRWLPFKEAAELATFNETKELCKKLGHLIF